MTTSTSPRGLLIQVAQVAQQWLSGWGRIVHYSALIAVLALSPSSYSRDARAVMSRHIVLDTAPMLLWFTLLCSLISLVLIRIVVVTALSYGLTQYALEMVVRVLVLELIPITAALFVAIRCTLPNGEELSAMRRRGALDELARQGIDPTRSVVLPRVLAGVVGVVTLAALCCVVSLVLAYGVVYGFTPWGFAGYTRTVGHVFDPELTLIFSLKTLMFSLAVSVIPMASALVDIQPTRSRTSAEVRGLIRMFALILLIEVASLVGNYY